MKRVNITMDEESLNIVKAYDLPVSRVIRTALQNYYKFNRPKKNFDGIDYDYGA